MSQSLGAQDEGRTGVTITYQSYYDLYSSVYTSQDVREAFVTSVHGVIPANQLGKGTFSTLICG